MNAPSANDFAQTMAPAMRAAARKKFGFVRMLAINPILSVFLRMAAEMLMKWLQEWLKNNPQELQTMAAQWNAEQMPEVRMGLLYPED